MLRGLFAILALAAVALAAPMEAAVGAPVNSPLWSGFFSGTLSIVRRLSRWRVCPARHQPCPQQ